MMPLRGFTLIEVVVTLALVGVLAAVALPVYEISAVRLRESELKHALREIRAALDNYKAAADAGRIPNASGESGYPPSLTVLAAGVENVKDPNKARLLFLRRVPRDPFFPDPNLPPEQTWETRSYESSANDSAAGANVFDISSRSMRKGLNGVPYKDW